MSTDHDGVDQKGGGRMQLGTKIDRPPSRVTNLLPHDRASRTLDDLQLSLGLANRAASLAYLLTDSERRDWQDAHVAAGVCIDRIETLAHLTGAQPERRALPALLRAQLFRARDTLQEATPPRLSAYGALAPELQRGLTERIARLQQLLDTLESAIADLPPGEL